MTIRERESRREQERERKSRVSGRDGSESQRDRGDVRDRDIVRKNRKERFRDRLVAREGGRGRKSKRN